MGQRILIIEDDPSMIDIVKQICTDQGFEVESCQDGESGLARALDGGFALVICDCSLPALGGVEVCTRLRKVDPLTPLLVLTGRDDEVTKVLLLTLGADDFVTKPFGVAELGARIRSLLRRTRLTAQEDKQEVLRPLVFGSLEIDLRTRRVRLGGQEIVLTLTEFDLLAYLAGRPGRPVTREEMMQEIWGYRSSAFDATITTQISRLRKKLEPGGGHPVFIETARGIGYRFTDRFGTGQAPEGALGRRGRAPD